MTNLATGATTEVATQHVVIVNGNSQMLRLLDPILDAGHYTVVFVASNHHAYSQIKRLQPHLVILCVREGETSGFQVLSMLKLDQETRGIPVFTCTTEFEGQTADDSEPPELSDVEAFAHRPTMRMN